MNVDVGSLSIDPPVVVLWSDNLIYGEYLLSTSELAWGQAIPAARRIEELLKAGLPNVQEIDKFSKQSRHRCSISYRLRTHIRAKDALQLSNALCHNTSCAMRIKL